MGKGLALGAARAARILLEKGGKRPFDPVKKRAPELRVEGLYPAETADQATRRAA